MRKQHGAVTLELIIGLPILIMALMAIVQFGLLSSNQAIVHSASRAGADAATGVALPTTGAVPAEILSAVNNVLAPSGVTASCVQVTHNIGDTPPYQLISGSWWLASAHRNTTDQRSRVCFGLHLKTPNSLQTC